MLAACAEVTLRLPAPDAHGYFASDRFSYRLIELDRVRRMDDGVAGDDACGAGGLQDCQGITRENRMHTDADRRCQTGISQAPYGHGHGSAGGNDVVHEDRGVISPQFDLWRRHRDLAIAASHLIEDFVRCVRQVRDLLHPLHALSCPGR